MSRIDREPTRSKLSNNWRIKSDATPRDRSDNAVRQQMNSYPSHRHTQQNSPIHENGISMNTEAGSLGIQTIRGEDDPRTAQAIAEGRRLYVGNLPYMAKADDVEDLFKSGEYRVVHINMSTDPYTGRNPSYCFVELETKEQADQAMQELNGNNILGRPVKIGPGVVAKSRGRPSRGQHDTGVRWDRARPQPIFDRWIRTDAADHWEGYNEQGRRLWVGGLPRMGDHSAVNREVRSLFRDYNVEAISKVVIPHAPAFGDPCAWNHRYLFMDFSTAEDADRARKAMNGTQAWGVKIRVLPARTPGSSKVGEREAWDQENKYISSWGELDRPRIHKV